MHVVLQKPTLHEILDIPSDGFSVIKLTGYGGGEVHIYSGDNWEDWDALVAAVEERRADR